MSRNDRSRGGGGYRRDVKQVSKNRFARLDADIVSAYDDDDDQPIPQPGRIQSVGRMINRLAGSVLHGSKKMNSKKDRQIMMGSAGINSEIINKVKIPLGKKFGLQWVLQRLNEQVEDLKPLLPCFNQRGDLEFYVKSDQCTNALLGVSRRIIHPPTGHRMNITAEKHTAPWIRLRKEEISLINVVVDSSYNSETRALDLSEFASKKAFIDNGLDMKLIKNNVLMAVLDRIDEQYGNVSALSLKGNRLRFLDYAAMLTCITKFVKVLDISDNQIDSMEQLSKLKGLPVQMLYFEGNPICENFSRTTDYRTAVHQVFPKVIMLDGEEIPACTDQLDESADCVDIPPKDCYFGTPTNQQTIEMFLREFFAIYDGVDGAVTRKNLLAAYDTDNAQFTVSIANMKDESPITYSDRDCFEAYARMGHNIIRKDKWEKSLSRSSRTSRGSMEIVVTLAKLPITKHYAESFVVDVYLETPNLLGFTLHGLFEDGKLASSREVPSLNYFSRSFIVTPRNGGIVVVADQLFISGVLTGRLERYRKLQTRCKSSGNVHQMTTAMVESSITPSEDICQQMLEQFCKDSGMRAEWSAKCLADSNWDYQAAGQMFMTMREQIPAEAFESSAH